jgi:hypothetical protein
VEVVRALLEVGADVNHAPTGCAPLYTVAQEGRVEVGRALVVLKRKSKALFGRCPKLYCSNTSHPTGSILPVEVFTAESEADFDPQPLTSENTKFHASEPKRLRWRRDATFKRSTP